MIILVIGVNWYGLQRESNKSLMNHFGLITRMVDELGIVGQSSI